VKEKTIKLKKWLVEHNLSGFGSASNHASSGTSHPLLRNSSQILIQIEWCYFHGIVLFKF